MNGLPHLRDVSNNNGPVRWGAERREGVRAAYCKVSQGLTFTDATAARNLHGAATAKIPAGGYHFATPGVGSPEAQADRLIALAPHHRWNLRPCLDAEWNGLRLPAPALAAWYLGFVLRIHRRLGYFPTVYGSPFYLEGFAVYHGDVFGRCPLWLADYGVKRPRIPAPWSHFAAWQWTDRFRDPAAGRVDDSFLADLGALKVPALAKTRRVIRTAGGLRQVAF